MLEKSFEELIREHRAAEILSISARTLQNWRCRGGGPAFIRLGRSVRYRAEDLQEFVLLQRTASARGVS